MSTMGCCGQDAVVFGVLLSCCCSISLSSLSPSLPLMQDMTRAGVIVLVMELCECDLDHLLKMRPFGDNDIITLLSQLGR